MDTCGFDPHEEGAVPSSSAKIFSVSSVGSSTKLLTLGSEVQALNREPTVSLIWQPRRHGLALNYHRLRPRCGLPRYGNEVCGLWQSGIKIGKVSAYETFS